MPFPVWTAGVRSASCRRRALHDARRVAREPGASSLCCLRILVEGARLACHNSRRLAKRTQRSCDWSGRRAITVPGSQELALCTRSLTAKPERMGGLVGRGQITRGWFDAMRTAEFTV